jgi:hypothetical protein
MGSTSIDLEGDQARVAASTSQHLAYRKDSEPPLLENSESKDSPWQ